ncbi:unnamed protein product, partial [Musa hybrid cultivar]
QTLLSVCVWKNDSSATIPMFPLHPKSLRLIESLNSGILSIPFGSVNCGT